MEDSPMKRLKFYLSLPLIIILFLTNNIYSQWTQLFPYGGQFSAIAATGTTFCAGTPYGTLFITTNSGTSWTQIGSSQNFGNINSIIFDGETIYVGCFNGVFQSTDSGITWNSINSGISGYEVMSLVKQGQNIFASTSKAGVFMLMSGDLWMQKNTGLPNNANVVSIVSYGTKLFVATLASGIFVSTNNGTTWASFSNGLSLQAFFNMHSLGVGTNYLFAGTSRGIYRSSFNTANWIKVSNEPVGVYADYFCFAFYDKNIFVGTQGGGVLVSENDGQSWKDFTNGMPLYFVDGNPFPSVYNTCYALGIGTNYMLACTDNGIYSFKGTETSWHSADNGLIAGKVISLFLDGQKLCAGTSKGGFFFSTDDGNNWYNLNGGINRSPNFFAGNNAKYFSSSANNLYSFTTATMGWNKIFTVNTAVWSILFYNSKTYLGTGDGIYASSDNVTFTKSISEFPVDQVVCLIASAGNLFAGLKNNGVYISTNNGIDWSPANSGISNYTVDCLLLNGQNLFAGTDGYGVYLSTNNGTSWTQIRNGLNGPNPRIFAFANSGQFIFAGATDGLYVTSNNGANWKSVNSTIGNPYIYSLLINGNYLYAGSDNVIYKRLISELTSVEDKNELPNTFELSQNYPNPFNPSTKVKFDLPQKSNVCLKVYNSLGQKTAILINKELLAGYYEIEFNGVGLSSGVYIYCLRAGNYSQTKKMILMK
jgi:photosystem II stability/assembly factor-like uncharacterized protein